MFKNNSQLYIIPELNNLLIWTVIGTIAFALIMGLVLRNKKFTSFLLSTMRALFYALIAVYAKQFNVIDFGGLAESLDTKRTVIEFGQHLLIVVSLLESIANIVDTHEIIADAPRILFGIWVSIWIVVYGILFNWGSYLLPVIDKVEIYPAALIGLISTVLLLARIVLKQGEEFAAMSDKCDFRWNK